ncbi:MAG: tyrosine recombinase XerC [Brachymonas sp.]|nr:tyrosine recombinase XerC [Brachymonas sp.]
MIEAYLTHCRVEKRLALRTLSIYTDSLRLLQTNACAAQQDITQVHQAHVRRWVAQLHSKGQSGRSIALTLSSWRGFYTWLGREEKIAANPVQNVRAPKQAKPLPKALAVDQAVQLASFKGLPEAAGFDPVLEARDAAITELLYGSGLRVSELVNLDLRASSTGERAGKGFIDLTACDVHVIGKGSKRRSVPLGSKSIETLQAWLVVREQIQAAITPARLLDAQEKDPSVELALFLSPRGLRMNSNQVWQRLKMRSQQAGLPMAVHPHMLRHSFASHVLQSSQDLRAVQELLGHANISTTQVYTRLDFQHLAKAYDAAHPRAKR